MGLALTVTLKFYSSVAKGLKLKIRKFCDLSPTFVEVREEKLIGEGAFWPPPVLNRVKITYHQTLAESNLRKLPKYKQKITLDLHHVLAGVYYQSCFLDPKVTGNLRLSIALKAWSIGDSRVLTRSFPFMAQYYYCITLLTFLISKICF